MYAHSDGDAGKSTWFLFGVRPLPVFGWWFGWWGILELRAFEALVSYAVARHGTRMMKRIILSRSC